MTTPSILPKLSPAELTAFEAEWNDHPGMRHMGARLDLSTPGDVCAVVDPIEPAHRGGLGTEAVNGAVIAGIFDLVIGLCGYLQTVGRRAGVAQLSIQFLRPVLGTRFEVRGRPVRAACRSMATAGRSRRCRPSLPQAAAVNRDGSRPAPEILSVPVSG